MSFYSTDQAQIHRVGGHLALDFVNTVGWRGTGREVDHINSATGLLAWAAQVGLVSSDASIGDDIDLVLTATRLRQAIRGALEADLNGRDSTADRATILDLAEKSLASAALVGIPAKLHYRVAEDAILGSVAWAAIDLLGSDLMKRVKVCPPDDCRWMFLDMSKNGSRRWCDMAACGTRFKVAQHRNRQKSG